MRREPRCEHLFLMGLCREPGCPHEEKGPALASRRVKARTCKRCGGPATVNIRSDGGSNWWCEGCNSTRRDNRVRGYLWTLMLALVGCGGVDVPKIPTPGRCGLWQDSDLIQADEGTCLWIRMQDDSAVTDGDCPDDGDLCLTIQGENTGVAWMTPTGRGIGLRIEYPLDASGVCPVSCDMGPHVCGSSDVLPGVCIPCPDGFIPRDTDPFVCPP